MKKIRIIHFAQSNGGVERYLYTYFKYSNKELFDNVLICADTFEFQKFASLVSDVTILPLKREISIKDDLISILKVRRIIKKYEPDILYCHSSKAGAIGRIANMGLNLKCIYNPHGWSFNMKVSEQKKALYIIIEKLLSLFTDKIICISEAEFISARQKKICVPEKLCIINNGIDLDERENSSENIDVKWSEDAFVVGMVGRISPQKAPDIFIRAANIIHKKIPQAHFVIIGDGEQREEIEKYAEQHSLSQCLTITGWVNNPIMWMKTLNVGVLLSRWEGFGLVLAEYMLCKLPIVATNVDAIPYVVENNKNGILVEKDDYKAVAEAIIGLFYNNELRNSMGEYGYKCVKELYSASRMVKDTEKLVSCLLHNDNN